MVILVLWVFGLASHCNFRTFNVSHCSFFSLVVLSIGQGQSLLHLFHHI